MEDHEGIAVLRNNGLQVTYQRLAIYQTLFQTKEHLSAEEVYRLVKKKFPMISLGTVYKTLERFYRSGIIVKVGHISDVSLYEADVSVHHHLICLECKSIRDVNGGEVQQVVSLPEGSDFEVERQQVILYGRCRECRRRGDSSSH